MESAQSAQNGVRKLFRRCRHYLKIQRRLPLNVETPLCRERFMGLWPGPGIDRSYHLWCGMTQLIFADAHSRRYPLYVCTVRNHLFLRISRLVFSPCPPKEVVKETTISRRIAHGMFNAPFALDVPPTFRCEFPLPGLFEISFNFPFTSP